MGWEWGVSWLRVGRVTEDVSGEYGEREEREWRVNGERVESEWNVSGERMGRVEREMGEGRERVEKG